MGKAIKTVQVSTLMLALVFGIGCGSKTLTRSKAKEMLALRVNQKQWVAVLWGNATDLVTPLRPFMIARGLLAEFGARNNDFTYVFYPSPLTPAGIDEAAKSRWKCFEGPRVDSRGVALGVVGVSSCEIPTTTRIDVEVTGIQFHQETRAAVVYTLTGVPTAWGKTLLDAGMNLNGKAGPQESVSHTAMFALYDDGWRVGEIR